MLFITDQELKSYLDFPSLISTLKVAFTKDFKVPLRHHHDFNNPPEGVPSTLLLMPAWQEGKYLGIKLVIVSPNNYKYDIPTIQGQYLLFDAHNGSTLAQMDAKVLTNLRTAAASALASSFLSRENSEVLLMLGTGSLAPYLIEAHLAVRPIKKVWVWGRNLEKAKNLVQKLEINKIEINVIDNFISILPEVDIISAATLAYQPIISGVDLRAGQHLDLVGSFKPDMRETDNAAITRSQIFVDTLEGAPKESGDIFQPIKEGILNIADIKGDLFDLCSGKVLGRTENKSITLFKSVGHALEDLAAAMHAYEKAQEK